MDFRLLLDILWQRKFYVIQSVLIVLISAASLSILVKPTYESTATILVNDDSSTSSLLSTIGLEDFSSVLSLQNSDEAQTNLNLITARNNLEYVIDRLQLKSRKGTVLKAEDFIKSTAVSYVLPQPYVSAEAVEETDLIKITAKSTDPVEAANISNILAEAFIKDNLKRQRAEYQSAKQFIETEIELVRKEYFKELENYRLFQVTEKSIDLETEVRIALEKMAELMKEKEDNIIDLSEVKAKIEIFRTQYQGQGVNFVSSEAISGNPRLEKLTNDLTALNLEIVKIMYDKTENHPDVKILKKQVQAIESEIQNELKAVEKTDKTLQALERDLAALKVHLVGVNADIEKYSRMLFSIPDKSLKIGKLELNLLAAKELYGKMLEYLYQVGVAEASTLSSIDIVEKGIPLPVNKPLYPDMIFNIVIAIILGLMFGLFLAFAIEYFDDQIKDLDQIKKELGLTYLGAIPKIKDSVNVFEEYDPKQPKWEAFRTVRTSMQFAAVDKPLNHVLLTSSVADEGKSFIAINLALSILKTGKKVLVVDCDLRKPTVHKKLQLPNTKGLTNLFTKEGDDDVSGIIQKCGKTGLDVITSGYIPPDPSRIVESSKLTNIAKKLEEKYDVIIWDAPPILLVNDAVFLSRIADGIIFVAQSGRLTRQITKQTREEFESIKDKLIGFVFNAVEMDGKHYYYKGYEYYTKQN